MFKPNFWLRSTFLAVLLGLQVSIFAPHVLAASDGTPLPDLMAQNRAQVSEQELTKFVSAWQKLGQIEQSFRQVVGEIVQEEELTQERFSAIIEALRNQEEPNPPLTKEEEEKLNTIISRLEPLRQQTQTRMENVLQSEGLESERFSEIYNIVQEDQNLQQRIQQMLGGN